MPNVPTLYQTRPGDQATSKVAPQIPRSLSDHFTPNHHLSRLTVTQPSSGEKDEPTIRSDSRGKSYVIRKNAVGQDSVSIELDEAFRTPSLSKSSTLEQILSELGSGSVRKRYLDYWWYYRLLASNTEKPDQVYIQRRPLATVSLLRTTPYISQYINLELDTNSLTKQCTPSIFWALCVWEDSEFELLVAQKKI